MKGNGGEEMKAWLRHQWRNVALKTALAAGMAHGGAGGASGIKAAVSAHLALAAQSGEYICMAAATVWRRKQRRRKRK
jgi:hypothetical protein